MEALPTLPTLPTVALSLSWLGSLVGGDLGQAVSRDRMLQAMVLAQTDPWLGRQPSPLCDAVLSPSQLNLQH